MADSASASSGNAVDSAFASRPRTRLSTFGSSPARTANINTSPGNGRMCGNEGNRPRNFNNSAAVRFAYDIVSM